MESKTDKAEKYVPGQQNEIMAGTTKKQWLVSGL